MKEERGVDTGKLIDALEGLGIKVKRLIVIEDVGSVPEIFLEGGIVTPEDYRD